MINSAALIVIPDVFHAQQIFCNSKNCKTFQMQKILYIPVSNTRNREKEKQRKFSYFTFYTKLYFAHTQFLSF